MLKKLTSKNKEMKERRANDLLGRCMAWCTATCNYWNQWDLMHSNNHENYYKSL